MVAQSFASSPFYYDVAEIGLAKRHAQIVFCTVKRGREPQILAKVFVSRPNLPNSPTRN
jgi:hypothetical protein